MNKQFTFENVAHRGDARGGGGEAAGPIARIQYGQRLNDLSADTFY